MTIALLAGHNAIHVISIKPDSQAGLDGILKEGDRVVEVNYQDIQQLPVPEALKRIKAMCHKANFVHIKVLRPIITRANSTSSSITAAQRMKKSERQESVESSDTSADTRRSFRPERSDSTVTAVAVPAAEEDDLIENYWSRRKAYWKNLFPESTKILLVEYDTEDSVCGLGLGIEGTMEKDTEHDLPRPHHYVIDVLPDGPVELREKVIPGDELLEVNKIILYEMDHLEVAKVLHEISSHGYLIFGRHQITDVDIPTPIHPRQRVNIVRESEEAPNLRAPRPGETTETLDSSTSSDGSDIVCLQPNDTGSRSSSSDATSDIDTCSPMDKVIFFKARRLDEAVQSREAKVVILDDVDEVLELPRRHQNISRERRELPDHIELKETPQSAVASNVASDSNGCSLSRLPMPARAASIQSPPPVPQPPLRPRDFAFTRRRVKSQVSDDLPPPEVKFHNDEQCFSVHISKQCGEFLGLELDAENGGPKGIRLMNITPGSALHRLIENQRHPGRQSGSHYRVTSMTEQHVSSRLPLPEPGDWIVGVAGCNFRHRSEFQARLLLRRLVLESGSFEIRYIPSETSALLCKQAWNGVHSEPDLSRVSDQ
ncbi:Patj homolog [Clonorchis sinensis]|uniref:Patj homolog n=1 Tax=Clonorchis sinensis TaxID=79923 RepID=H2KQP8_CLOSI|nr:Patj homolog [Clonorchis sinensis]